LVSSHYNFSELEKRHYYLSISKFSIAILLLPDSRHFLRLPNVGPQCQTVFVHTCFVWFPLHLLTCGPHSLASSSTSIYLERSGGGVGLGPRRPLPPSVSGSARHCAPWRPASLRGGGRLLVFLTASSFVEVPVVSIAGRTPSAPRSICYYAAPRARYQRRVEQGKGEEAASLTSMQPNHPGFERIFTLAIDAAAAAGRREGRGCGLRAPKDATSRPLRLRQVSGSGCRTPAPPPCTQRLTSPRTTPR
jgi:hypothetical protein